MDTIEEDVSGGDSASAEVPNRKMVTSATQSSIAGLSDFGEEVQADDEAPKKSKLELARERRASRTSIDGGISDDVARRASLMRRAHSKQQPGTFAGAADLTLELSFRSGIVMDFMERTAGVVDNKYSVLPLELLRSRSMIQQLTVLDYLKFKFAGQMICRDAFKRSLMEGIIAESKARGQFKKTGIEDVRQWAVTLKKLKTDVTCLNTQTKVTVMRWKAEHIREMGFPASVAERVGKAEEFWSTYADRHRVVSGTVNTRGGPPGGGGSACNGRPKYGMAWDIHQGPVWRMVSPAPGSLLQKEIARHEAEAGISDATRGMGYKSRSAPSLQKVPTQHPGRGSLTTTHDPHSPKSVKNMQRELLPPIEHRHKYLNQCGSDKVPIPLPFVTGHSKAFDASGRSLVDKELLAFMGVFEDMNEVRDISLFDNGLLTDKALSRFLQTLHMEHIHESLRRLNLGRCLRGGKDTINATSVLLVACTNLRELNLSQVSIPLRLQLGMARAIGQHPSIQVVNLAETGFMPGDSTMKSIACLFESKTIKDLDLSWNVFDCNAFKLLGECVTRSTSLTKLKVACCSGNVDLRPAQDVIPPLSVFLEQMAYDRSLTSLDISMNRCDFRTALILEDSLDTHLQLKELIMSENPLGVLGVRSILRLLCRDHTGLTTFNMEACYGGKVMANAGGREVAIFSYTNPGGMYKLELWRPYDRALLRMLYKLTALFGLQKEDAFVKTSYKKGRFPAPAAWVHAEKDAEGVWQVATEGELELVYSVEKAILKKFLQPGPNQISETDNAGFLDGYLKDMRFAPGFRKVISLFAFWSELALAADEIGMSVTLDALSKDFNLSLAYLEVLCRHSDKFAAEVVMRLQPSVPGDVATKYLCSRLFTSLESLLAAQQQMLHLTEFNVDNPTGRYRLELSNCSEYAVAERLLLLDRWEAAVDRKLERADVSQLGNGTHLRNPLYQGRSVHSFCYSIAEWKLPEHGELQVDYASNQKPPKETHVLSDELWERLLMDMFASSCSPEDRIAVMRSISHGFYITSAHMRSMIGYFKTEEQRAEVFISFYLRIVDIHNSKMFRVRFESAEEVRKLQIRLGFAAFFPFFQPENAKFELELAENDQRLCATMFVNLAIQEGMKNLQKYAYTKGDGTKDPMTMGVPKSWALMDQVPKDGVFSGEYNCAPEYRKFSHRKDIASRYGYINGLEDLQEDKVLWWTGLKEPPEDVIKMLLFFIPRYNNIKETFIDIDGVDGNGVITIREFMDGLNEMKFEKFDRKKGSPDQRTKEQRVDAVFRYMDQGGEGSVSAEEWAILGQLWSELDMSIKEFVHFLVLFFGDDLSEAWEALDSDESGEMDESEFLEAVEKIGYFGPASIVFQFLDASDDGNISFDEFEILEKYKPAKHKDHDAHMDAGDDWNNEQPLLSAPEELSEDP